MTELTFARAFLTALDSRPITISADHVEDPRSFPSNRPAIILPKMPKAMSKPTTTTPQTDKPLTITLKSLRNPPLNLSLPATPQTSILDLKQALASQAGVPVDKARILHRKKPVPDSKIVKDLIEGEEDTLELAVMVMGGAAVLKAPAAAAATSGAAVPGLEGGDEGAEKVVESDAFWEDLRAFVVQRVKDEKVGGELAVLFKKSWEENKGK
ncbi:Uncharacterized protein SAPIO_CDS3945 [Scedosporium apiospermum]|uniref:Ubiquitin-like domain-containing protein n=1 Tax=Pseudallescheria apiosperma TaxID=563466 RepID=A0A084G8Y5_PSEDA|nr:Uncharacterized protein SAPIO_CDS3945 [Scedosporium apiospermum]KEZ43797.1 Uncharacterized protein SAPIO_CDS3945 [Scedosporium apiospermum]